MGCGCRKRKPKTDGITTVKITGTPSSGQLKASVNRELRKKMTAMSNQRNHICKECPFRKINDHKQSFCQKNNKLIFNIANNIEIKCPLNKF